MRRPVEIPKQLCWRAQGGPPPLDCVRGVPKSSILEVVFEHFCDFSIRRWSMFSIHHFFRDLSTQAAEIQEFREKYMWPKHSKYWVGTHVGTF